MNNWIQNIESVKKVSKKLFFQFGNLLLNWCCQFDGKPLITQGDNTGLEPCPQWHHWSDTLVFVQSFSSKELPVNQILFTNC